MQRARVNGTAWTRAEIARLVEAFESGGGIEDIAEELDRTAEAVMAKAKRLKLSRLPTRPPTQIAERPQEHDREG